MIVSKSAAAPRRGRPRSPGADEAIMTATIELAGEVGIHGMSMDELASRAGVSKASIYRRWSSKEALVLDALRGAMSPLDNVNTGSLRGDLDLYLGELVERFDRGQLKDVLPHLIEVACHDPAIQSALDEYVQFRRRPLRAIFEQARMRRELPDDTDIDVLIDATIGPFLYRRLLTHESIDREFVNRLIKVILPTI